MCGILGLLVGDNPGIPSSMIKSTIDNLFRLSESRGKEAAGVAVLSGQTINVYKQHTSASTLIKNRTYENLLNNAITNCPHGTDKNRPRLTIIGHSRLVTNGTMEDNKNNQPVIKNGLIGVHNGIIVNDEVLWKQFPDLEKKYEVDTEVLLSLIWMFYKEKGLLVGAVQAAFSLIQGTASIAVLTNDDQLLLATNNGSLYTCTNETGDLLVFASERYILKKLIGNSYLRKILNQENITQIKPGNGCLIDLKELLTQNFSLTGKANPDYLKIIDGNRTNGINIVDLSFYDAGSINDIRRNSFNMRNVPTSNTIPQGFDEEPPFDSLRRCTKCILPETMPFIEFNDKGVCNYCNNYKKVEIEGEDALKEIADKYINKSGEPDCIFAFSGGRDSSYGLHYVKNVLKMNPIAFTYDWGMVTDLARRNQAKICGKLGIEHILISADINAKRENIRKNIEAWLKKPDLGVIPLFMAGDKQFFYYAKKLREQNNVKLIFWCENRLEKTDFKTGFCGIKPDNGKQIYTLSFSNKIKLASYYAKQYLSNPSYLNTSVIDTLFAFFSMYLMPQEHLLLYNYIKWDEKKIMSTLAKEYDWEGAKDTKNTWRIGDGTSAFYNYIYYTVAGFTENDTFRSNQIREGLLTREEALEMVKEENKPRYDAIKAYCDVIGIDYDKTLKIINSIPRLY